MGWSKNYQAAKNLRAMKKGDQCFFTIQISERNSRYSRVIKEHYLDKTDQSGHFVAITVRFLKS